MAAAALPQSPPHLPHDSCNAFFRRSAVRPKCVRVCMCVHVFVKFAEELAVWLPTVRGKSNKDALAGLHAAVFARLLRSQWDEKT